MDSKYHSYTGMCNQCPAPLPQGYRCQASGPTVPGSFTLSQVRTRGFYTPRYSVQVDADWMHTCIGYVTLDVRDRPLRSSGISLMTLAASSASLTKISPSGFGIYLKFPLWSSTPVSHGQGCTQGWQTLSSLTH